MRCLMMPYIQGDFSSVPDDYALYRDIIESVFFNRGDIGFLTIDESVAVAGKPHRGARAMYGRAIHTEAGKHPRDGAYQWGWGSSHRVTLDQDVRILLANNLDDSCAIWDSTHENTSLDGDIGYAADDYLYGDAIFMGAGEVHEIGILTPHESVPVQTTVNRQFLRIMSSGIHGRESYFTLNPLFSLR
jgi:hypothetical protein